MVAFSFPAMSSRAGSTSLASACGGDTAIYAMLGVFAWCAQFPPVNLLVAGNTQCDSVIDISGKIRKVGKAFLVVGVKFATMFAAFLAGIIISIINLFAPFSKGIAYLTPFCSSCFAIFPHGVVFARVVLRKTVFRAKLLSLIGCAELVITADTFFLDRNGPIGPTVLGAKFRRFFSVCGNFIRRTAYSACKTHSINATVAACWFVAVNTAKSLIFVSRMKKNAACFAMSVIKCGYIEVVALNKLSLFAPIAFPGWFKERLAAAAFACFHRLYFTTHIIYFCHFTSP